MEEPIVEIKYGKLRGKIAEDYKGGKYYSFQGIPYAKPPIGELRFKSPIPPEKWEGIRDATKQGSESLSHHFIIRENIIGSEDCLYLNVYTLQILKTDDKVALKPVMFWIHGGGFHYGSGNTDFYGPEHLITGDVVIVTFNYRLGVLGFLSLEDSSLDVPGNAGMKDMVQALKWVQENIKTFGGDPKCVTIFGESAGGASSHLLMLSPLAKGLFHRAILQSGCALNPWIYGSRSAKQLTKVLKLPTDNEKDLLEYLRKIPAQKFIDIQDEIKDSSGCDELRPFSVVIEKPSPSEPNFLPQHPLEIITSGNYNKVPVMIGYADREGIITELGHIQEFGSLQVPTDLATRIPFYYNIPNGTDLSKNVAQKIKEFYFRNKEPSNETEDEFLQLETDVLFWRGIFVTIRNFLNNLNLPIYLYRMTANTELNLIKKIGNVKRSGAAHCDIVGYLFTTDHTSKFDLDSIEGKCVDQLVTLWTNFAKTSNPNSDKLKFTWNPVQKNSYNYLDIGNDLFPGQNPDMDRMKFWDKIATGLNSKF